MSIRRKVALWFVSIFLVIAGLGTGAYGWFNVQAAYLATSSLSSDAAGEEARMARSDERLRKEIEVREKDYEKLRRRALLQQKYYPQTLRRKFICIELNFLKTKTINIRKPPGRYNLRYEL